jgi:[ribosomal protein S18]-alanine N-acetyltransferase
MIAFISELFSRAQPKLTTAGPNDAPAMAEVHAQAFRRGWSEAEFERLLADANIVAHRAIAGRVLVGFVVSRFAADEAEILSIAVAPSWRGRGIAGRLLDLQLRRLAGLGISRLFLEVDEGNVAARRLYARAQFREVGRRGAYYHAAGDAAPPSAALILRRDLA